MPIPRTFECTHPTLSNTHTPQLETPVTFPVDGLDSATFCLNPSPGAARYALAAVSNHFGAVGGGHYTAHARSDHNGRWYEFDDSKVRCGPGDRPDSSHLCAAAHITSDST